MAYTPPRNAPPKPDCGPFQIAEWGKTPAGRAWIVRDMTPEEIEAAFPTPEPVTLPPTAADVKAEAHRRIIAFLPEWKQRNLTAQAAQLAEKGRANWSEAELEAWNAGLALWNQVAAIRTASDLIEAMDPIPTDYTDDAYWGAE